MERRWRGLNAEAAEAGIVMIVLCGGGDVFGMLLDDESCRSERVDCFKGGRYPEQSIK
jgi:hypothetical protein